MSKEKMPELFELYWKMQKQAPTPSRPLKNDKGSKEWQHFREVLKKRIELDLSGDE